MAEEKKSIEISYKANLKDLVSKLKTLPNVTGAEAKKMVSELDRQLKQAERAAKKSADAQKKAAKAAADAARRGGQSFRNMANNAENAKAKIGEVGEQAGDVDRGFSAIGLALRTVNPELAAAADGLADASAVTEGLALSFKSLNPLVVAAGLAIGAATLAFTQYHKEAEKAKKLTLEMREANKAMTDTLKGQRENFEDVVRKLQNVEDQLAHTTGATSDFDFAMQEAAKAAAAQFDVNIQAQKEIIAQRESDLALVNRLQQGQMAMTDAEKERLKTLQLQIPLANKNVELGKDRGETVVALRPIEDAIKANLESQNQALEKITDAQAQAVELAQMAVEFEHEQTAEKERQVAAEEKELELLQKKLEDEEKLRALDEAAVDNAIKTFEAQKELNLALTKLRETDHEAAIRQINERFDTDKRRLEMLQTMTGDDATAKAAIAELELAREQTLHEVKLENRAKIKEIDQQIATELMDSLGSISTNLETVYTNVFMHQKNVVAERRKEREEFEALSKAEQDRVNKQEKIMLSFFRAEQALSLAGIAMSTAEAVMAAQAKYVPGTPAAIAATMLAVTMGATQAAKVASRRPPSLHMGGMAPDEMGATILTGEAVLDRSTVRRIGGEQGVKKLQKGGQDGDQVVVIQPFRHFGRFTREIGLRAPRSTGIVGY